MVGKALLATQAARNDIEKLHPLQVGVGIPGAADAVAMGLQSLVNSQPTGSHWVLLKVDISNAFNTIHRQHVLEQTAIRCPTLFNYLRFNYRSHAPLFCGPTILESQAGVHQGCPLGPIGFATGLHTVIETIQQDSSITLTWQSWYLDDGVILGDAMSVSMAFAVLQRELPAIGLTLNPNKCEIWGPGASYCHTLQHLTVVPWQPDSGVTCLGVPINYPGSHARTTQAWDKATKVLEVTSKKVTDVTDAQTAHHLLRKCLDACKVNHLLRATDTYQAGLALQQCDDCILDTFDEIVGGGLTPEERTQASLPLAVGGCGVRVPSAVRPAARISALLTYYTQSAAAVGAPPSARELNSQWIAPTLQELVQKLPTNFDPVSTWMGQHTNILRADPTQLQQKWWSAALGRHRLQTLLDNASPRDQARLLEQSNSIGYAFMSVPPNSKLFFTMTSDNYKLALQWWLGKPILKPPDPGGPPYICPGCRAPVDPHGDHLLCCKRNNYATRHGAVQASLYNAFLEAGQECKNEVPVPIDGEVLRPADLLIANWTSGRDVAIDVTVCHGWQQSERRNDINNSGDPARTHIARERWRTFLVRKEEDKVRKYKAKCDSVNWGFTPTAFGTWGGQGPEAAKALARVAKRAAEWREGDLRQSQAETIKVSVGWAIMSQVVLLLQAKNNL